jgi:hypothetical protein
MSNWEIVSLVMTALAVLGGLKWQQAKKTLHCTSVFLAHLDKALEDNKLTPEEIRQQVADAKDIAAQVGGLFSGWPFKRKT